MMLRSLFTLSIKASTIHPRLSEWHLTLVMFCAGLTILLGDTFTLPVYTTAKTVAPAWIWGSAMLLLSTFRLIVLYINGRLKRSPHLRSVLATISSLVWMGLLVSLMAFETPLLLGSFIFAAIFVEQISAYRAAQDARMEDESGARNGSTG